MRLAFTTIYGGYDLPLPQPKEDGIKYVCFTDYVEAPYPWEIRRVEGDFRNDHYKCRYIWHNINRYCDYDQSILLAGRTLVKCDLNEFIDTYHKGDITVLRHEYYPDIKEEAKAVIRNHQAPKKDVMNAYNYCIAMGFPLKFGLFALNLVMRNNSDKVNKFFDTLSKLVQLYCHRDQMLFPFVWWKYAELYDVKIHVIEENVYEAGLFKLYDHA